MATRKQTDASMVAAAVAAARALDGTADDEITSPVPDAEEIEDALDVLRNMDDAGAVQFDVTCESPTERAGKVERLRKDQLDWTRFKNKYGPGVYVVTARDAKGGYIKGGRKQITISDIGYEPKDKGGSSDVLAQFMAAQSSREAEASKARRELMLALAPALITGVGGIVTALMSRKNEMDLPALITALRPERHDSLADTLKTLAAARDLQGNGNDGLESAFKILERLKDLPAAAAEGSGGWLGTAMGVLKDLAPVAKDAIGQMLENRRQGQPPPQQVRAVSGPVVLPQKPPAPQVAAVPPLVPATPPPTPKPPPDIAPAADKLPDNQPEGDPMMGVIEPWLKKRAADILEWAELDMDPALCAETLLALVPPGYRRLVTVQQLVEWVGQPDAWDVFVKFYAPIAPHRKWVEELREEVLIALREGMDGATVAPDGATVAQDPPP